MGEGVYGSRDPKFTQISLQQPLWAPLAPKIFNFHNFCTCPVFRLGVANVVMSLTASAQKYKFPGIARDFQGFPIVGAWPGGGSKA